MVSAARWQPITTHSSDAVSIASVATFAAAGELLLATRDTEPYLLLVCADSSTCSVAEICVLVDAAIDTRCAFFCAWGPDCERVHDIYDETCVIREVDNLNPPPFTMTTGHAKDTLAAAVWNALFCFDADACGDEWRLETLPRRLLLIGSATTGDRVLQVIRDAEVRDD